MVNSILIYVLTFVPTILGMNLYTLVSNRKKRLLKLLFCVLIIAPIALLTSLRLGVGTDYYNYEYVFRNAIEHFQWGNTLSEFTTTEPLYVFLEYISFVISDNNYHIFLFIVSSVTLLPVVLFIMDEVPKKHKGLSLFIYLFIFYLTSFNIMRQMLAVSFVIYAYKYLINKNLYKYLFCVMIATLFHNSAIIAVIFCFLNLDITIKRRLNLKQLLSVLAIWLVPIGYIFVLTVGPKLPVIGEYFSNYTNVQNASNIYFLLLTLLPIVPALVYKKVIVNEANGNIIYNTLLFTIVVAFLGITNDWAFRLLYFPSTMIIFLYPLIITKLKKTKGSLFWIFIVIYLLIISYLTFVTFGFNNVVPYEKVLFNTLLNNY